MEDAFASRQLTEMVAQISALGARNREEILDRIDDGHPDFAMDITLVLDRAPLAITKVVTDLVQRVCRERGREDVWASLHDLSFDPRSIKEICNLLFGISWVVETDRDLDQCIGKAIKAEVDAGTIPIVMLRQLNRFMQSVEQRGRIALGDVSGELWATDERINTYEIDELARKLTTLGTEPGSP